MSTSRALRVGTKEKQLSHKPLSPIKSCLAGGLDVISGLALSVEQCTQLRPSTGSEQVFYSRIPFSDGPVETRRVIVPVLDQELFGAQRDHMRDNVRVLMANGRDESRNVLIVRLQH